MKADIANGMNAGLVRSRPQAFRTPTTLALDNQLLAKARSYTGIHEASALVDRALKYLIELEASRQLARLHGVAPGLTDTAWRQPRRDNDAR